MTTKYVVIVPDGAADEPQDIFDGKTVLEAADIPNIDLISKQGRQGLAYTIPKGMSPGSDVALMSVLGYDPAKYYTGRAPIEAVAQDIVLDVEDWVFRCNLVTFADQKMADHSAGHISTKEAVVLIQQLHEAINNPDIKFYTGLSYRHLCVIRGHKFNRVKTWPPHDIIGQKVSKHLPVGPNASMLCDIMACSQQLFEDHPVNRVRNDLHENPVSSVWLWGQGQKTTMERFSTRFGLNGAVITAVDLVKGLAKLVDFDLINVEGATGYVDTNYAGKGGAAIEALERYDIVFVHIEAPDEAGHAGNPAAKKKALEMIDKHIVGPLYEAIQTFDSFRILVMPDHPTPIRTRSHSPDPVPFAMAGRNIIPILKKPFSEHNAASGGLVIQRGCDLMEYFLRI